MDLDSDYGPGPITVLKLNAQSQNNHWNSTKLPISTEFMISSQTVYICIHVQIHNYSNVYIIKAMQAKYNLYTFTN